MILSVVSKLGTARVKSLTMERAAPSMGGIHLAGSIL